ncbi:MAG: hypothetical protein US54_C0001G0039 [Candidatus Roizmanbacteria bacterium GW2011_GWA2_37_7]|uniref:Double zinc ribbon domain-containing protein n=1 Tax=Candidatus Roizmanbacteria bacterium GW2011_GWA2_37_7 TaxID=1618481 RepID=A0A0G0JPR8_9BACT|nr:MAG: hypothetical protein US54_C0001G0039 [Candidatus Roizmanbacteria bacterium GW2011_GWA2_37_7]
MFFDILFPARCVGCARIGSSICSNCVKEIYPIQKDLCPGCFQSSPDGKTHARCYAKTHLDGALAIVRFCGVTKKIIKEAKYQRAHKALKDFFMHIPKHWFNKVQKLPYKNISAALCPIPLHKTRQNIRGFNQAEILANHFKQEIKLPVEDLLVRIKNTPPQAQQKSRALRKANIYGAFQTKISKKLPSTIILIDDLYTSASTANEAARTLKKSGTTQVFLLALAHGQ